MLEALLEHERSGGTTPEVTAARLRGQDYLLERRLFRRRSTGEVIERDRKSGADWTRFAFPAWWHYDVLRALEYLRQAGVTPDARVGEAIALVACATALVLAPGGLAGAARSAVALGIAAVLSVVAMAAAAILAGRLSFEALAQTVALPHDGASAGSLDGIGNLDG